MRCEQPTLLRHLPAAAQCGWLADGNSRAEPGDLHDVIFAVNGSGRAFLVDLPPPRGRVSALSYIPLTALLIATGDADLSA